MTEAGRTLPRHSAPREGEADQGLSLPWIGISTFPLFSSSQNTAGYRLGAVTRRPCFDMPRGGCSHVPGCVSSLT